MGVDSFEIFASCNKPPQIHFFVISYETTKIRLFDYQKPEIYLFPKKFTCMNPYLSLQPLILDFTPLMLCSLINIQAT